MLETSFRAAVINHLFSSKYFNFSLFLSFSLGNNTDIVFSRERILTRVSNRAVFKKIPRFIYVSDRNEPFFLNVSRLTKFFEIRSPKQNENLSKQKGRKIFLSERNEGKLIYFFLSQKTFVVGFFPLAGVSQQLHAFQVKKKKIS